MSTETQTPFRRLQEEIDRCFEGDENFLAAAHVVLPLVVLANLEDDDAINALADDADPELKHFVLAVTEALREYYAAGGAGSQEAKKVFAAKAVEFCPNRACLAVLLTAVDRCRHSEDGFLFSVEEVRHLLDEAANEAKEHAKAFDPGEEVKARAKEIMDFATGANPEQPPENLAAVVKAVKAFNEAEDESDIRKAKDTLALHVAGSSLPKDMYYLLVGRPENGL